MNSLPSFCFLDAVNEKVANPRYKYDFSCVLLPLGEDIKYDFLKECQEFIDPRDLNEKGLETDPHLTLKYGLHTNAADEVQQALVDFGLIRFSLFFVSVFFGEDSGKDFDVIKLDVLDPNKTLYKANEMLSGLENTQTFSVFKPHVTIAYVKKGAGYKYLGKPFGLSFREIVTREVVYSDRNGNKHPIFLSD